MNSRVDLAMYVRLTTRLPSGLFACLIVVCMSIYLFVCLSICSVSVCLSACLYERKDSPLVTKDLVLTYLAVLNSALTFHIIY